MPSANDPADAPEAPESSYVVTFDPDGDERASEAVITAVAALAGSKPAELGPLYETVDPDALDTLVEHAQRSDAGAQECWFTFEGFDVGVRSDGQIRIHDASVPTSP